MSSKIPNPYATSYRSIPLEVEAFTAPGSRFAALCRASPSRVWQTEICAMHEALEGARYEIDCEHNERPELLPVEPFLVEHFRRTHEAVDSRLVKHARDQFEIYVWLAFRNGDSCAYRSARPFESKLKAEQALMLALINLKSFDVESDWIQVSLEDRIGIHES